MTSPFTPPAPLKTAVLFLVFNRPDTTAEVFEAIRQVKPPRLYVASDGPREGREGEVSLVAKVREIATTIDWPCELKTLFREENLGCKYAVSSAITWFFQQEEQGIILEDDCLPTHSFFWYCENLLEKYKQSEVYHIGGYSIQNGRSGGCRMSRLVPIWGWATWRRAWNFYDIDMKSTPISNLDYSYFGKYASNVENTFRRHLKNCIETWDTQWAYTCVRDKAISIIPEKSLIKNIGFGPDATHTFKIDSVNSLVEVEEVNLPLLIKQYSSKEVLKLDEEYLKKFYQKSFLEKIKKLIKKLQNERNRLLNSV